MKSNESFQKFLHSYSEFLNDNISFIVSLLTMAFTITYLVVNGFEQEDFWMVILLYMFSFQTITTKYEMNRQMKFLTRKILEGDPSLVIKQKESFSEFSSLMNEAKSDVYLVGQSLSGLLARNSHDLIQALVNGVNISVLLSDPDNADLLRYSTQDNEKMKIIEANIRSSLAQLENIKQITRNSKGKLDIRVSSAAFHYRGVMVDSNWPSAVMLIIFSDSTSNFGSPPYFLLRKHTSKDLFRFFEQQYLKYWDYSKQTDNKDQRDI